MDNLQVLFLASLEIQQRRTLEPIIIALVGLTGSGKSSVAKELATAIKATIIEGNAIRVFLRKEGRPFEEAQTIAENVAREILNRGGNVILDSDFITQRKRHGIRTVAKEKRARLFFIRTFATPDVMFGRIITASYRNRPEDFFGGAKTLWSGTEQSRGAVIKIREMWRRTSHHYRWSKEGGGKWVLKKLRFKLLAEIDATDPKAWKAEVQKLAKELRAL